MSETNIYIVLILTCLFITFITFKLLLSVFAPNLFSPKAHCLECGHHGKTKKTIQGSSAVELILYFLFIIPGLIYSFWRISTKSYVCTNCKGSKLAEVRPPKVYEKLTI